MIQSATEIEIKIKLADETLSHLRRYLEHHAQKMPVEQHVEYYLDNPQKSFYYHNTATQPPFIDALGTLRVRMINGERTTVCYKYRHLDTQGKTSHRDEYEAVVSDGDTMRQLFHSLGYIDEIVIRKTRTPYTLNHMDTEFEITIDEVEHCGTFVEVELKSPVENPQKGLKLIYSLLPALGISEFQQFDRSYVHMLKNPGVKFGEARSIATDGLL